jgi:hypothetical protein
MSWQYLKLEDEVADLLRLRADAERRGAPDQAREIDARIQQLTNGDGNGGREH